MIFLAGTGQRKKLVKSPTPKDRKNSVHTEPSLLCTVAGHEKSCYRLESLLTDILRLLMSADCTLMYVLDGMEHPSPIFQDRWFQRWIKGDDTLGEIFESGTDGVLDGVEFVLYLGGKGLLCTTTSDVFRRAKEPVKRHLFFLGNPESSGIDDRERCTRQDHGLVDSKEVVDRLDLLQVSTLSRPGNHCGNRQE